MIIRVLIINRQLVFAVTIKQALEQTAAFEVHPFTDPNAAMEYLRTHPHDVALVDFSITVMPGPEIVRNLRQIQPEIAIIASPSQSAQVMRELEVQQTIDPPFSARSIIPVIEQAVQQTSKPLSALTQTFMDPESAESFPTEILADEPPSDQPPGAFPPREEQPAQTFILGERDDVNQPDDAQHTRVFSDEEVAEDAAMSTHILGEDEEVPGTRIFGDPQDADSHAAAQEPDDDITRMLNAPPESMVTHIFEDDSSESSVPPDLPEFSTLDDVLNLEAPSSLYEPPTADEDTPAVPEVDSDAVRQYLATESNKGDGLFDQMLGEISSEDEAESHRLPANTGFDELVKSMRGDQSHTPLPDRHQQFVEFILTGGMDGLLSEIEKAQTGPLDSEGVPDRLPEERPEASNFEKLAREEPPLPSLEESGTVGDLMIGVSDTSFRNVLNMMRGEELVDETGGQMPSTDDDDYAALFDSQVAAERDEQDEEPPAAQPVRYTSPPSPILDPDYYDDDDSSIPAQLILETAMDESTPPEAFSINSLLGTIEQQLTEHKPDIRPLPSWNVNSIQRPSPSKRRKKDHTSNRYIEEPDFLPEEFTTDYMPAVDEEAAEDEAFAQEESVEAIYDQMLHERGEVPRATDETLSMFEALGESVASETGPPPYEEPEDLIPSLEDTSPIQPPSDDTMPELPGDDSHFLETVLGEAAYAQDAQDEFDNYDEEAEAAEEMDWNPAAMFQQSDWNATEAPPVDSESEDDWTMPEELDQGEPAEFEEMLEESNDFEAAFDDVLGETGPEEALDEAETDFDPDYAAELSEADEDDWAISVEEEPAPESIEEAAPSPLEQEFDLVDRDDPYIAQIALSLTQVSLELAAEATILTNEEEIVAIAGELDPNDVDEIRDLIADDWDADGGDQARVRFITLASSGKDYMLYSRRTVGDFTLSMVFAGSTPLRDIRRQGKRLLEALEAVPDEVAEHEAPELTSIQEPVPTAVTPVEGQTYQPFTYLWLLRDAEYDLEDHTQRAIAAGLSMQLMELGWQIKTLQVQGEYVYVRADVPGERPAHEIISELKQRTAEIARVQEPDLEAPDLWADSYLVMMPGRELDPEEIDQFIDFERLY